MHRLRVFVFLAALLLAAATGALAVGVACGDGCQKCEWTGNGGSGTHCAKANWENGQCYCFTLRSLNGFGTSCTLLSSPCLGVIVTP